MNARKSSNSRFNTEKKSHRNGSDNLPVFGSESKNANQDFDDFLAMEDSCDLRKKTNDESTVESSTADDKQSQQTSFQKVWSKEVTQLTKVSKSKDILPVLRDLVASLE